LAYLPTGLPAISPQNAGGLQPVTWLAEDRLTGLVWSSNDAWVGVISITGVTIYEAEALPEACYGEGCNLLDPDGSFIPVQDLDPRRVFLSPDGRSLGVLRIDEFAIDLYDVDSGQVIRTLEWLDHASPVLYGVAFSPDWRTLAWYTRGTLLLMDVVTGHPGPMLGTEDFIQVIAFSPDSSLIAAAAAGTVNGKFQPLVQIWDVTSGEPFVTLTGYTQVSINGVANLLRFSQDSHFLMAGHSDGSIAVWNIPDGTPRMFIGGLNIPVSDLAMTPDEHYLVAVYAGSSSTRWDLTKSQDTVSWSGNLVAIAPDAGSVALLTSDGWEKLIDTATDQKIATLGVNPYLDSLVFSPDGGFLSALSLDLSTLSLWHIPDVVELAPLSITPELAADIAYAPDGTTIAAAWYGCQARLWDAPSGEIAAMLEPAEADCGAEPSVVISPNGEALALASGSQGTAAVTLWDYQTGHENTTLTAGEGSLESLAISPNGTLLAAGTGQTNESGTVMGGQAVVWDLASQTVVQSLPHNNWVTSLAFAPDGHTLATGTASLNSSGAEAGSLVTLWDLRTGQQVRTIEFPGDHVVSLAFSPDGTLLAAGNWSGDLVLWEAGSETPLSNLGARIDPVIDLAFSPDGTLLGAGLLSEGPGTVEIWELASRQQLSSLEGSQLAFSPDGTSLASVVFSSVRLWGVAP
jgi:WD40 repeat protein